MNDDHSRSLVPVLGLALALCIGALPLAAQTPTPNAQTRIFPASPEDCALLDDPLARSRMDGLLFSLIMSCDRHDLLGSVNPEYIPAVADGAEGAVDVKVNDDVATDTTQSETAIAENPNTGTLCSGFNDSCELFCPDGGGGLTGFARSTDGGATWDDRGAVDGSAFGDPSIVYREADGDFYFATLFSGGALGLYKSTDDCQTFSFVSNPATGGDDKELLAVDNTGGANDGNIYIFWTDFGAGGNIATRRSIDGGVTWSTQMTVGTGIVQGAWPIVAPNGDVFVAWLQLSSFPNGDVTIKVARSTDGGLSYTDVTNPVTGATGPRDQAATAACGRDALNGNIRYLASPQLAATDVGGGTILHVVYSYDPDGFNTGDVIDVFYRRSTDNGATWGTEVRLNDDATTRDQYFPTLFADGDTVIASFYDRRLDAGNLLQDRFQTVSTDGGLTWGANVRVSDTSSPIELDPALATCYHGDYDQNLITTSGALIDQWADDREDDELADVFVEADSNSIFADGFESGDTSAWSVTIP